ncbi:MAG: cell surface protein SprA [Flavobacteriaceae bacterium]|nr:cell surface protein SprA [Flavobacteriaceae bacterium]
MFERTLKVVFKSFQSFILTLIWIIFGCGIVLSQENAQLGTLDLPNPVSIVSQYIYDIQTDRYIFSKEIGGYPISVPLVLTVEEYQAMILKEKMKNYFQEKIQALSGRGNNVEETQKNLLPELYVNNKFFESIFGSNSIDISPQGSIGIDLGYRYQRNDNPIASVINRRSPGFEFDQRISLSLLGEIGERLRITANYDTESTFDFQNLVKIQFNPPQVSELKGMASGMLPGELKSKLQNIENKFDELGNKVNEVKQQINNVQNKVNQVKDVINEGKNTLNQARQKIETLKQSANQIANDPFAAGNRVSEYLNGKVTEDAILQNIDIGNISMPINSNLIQGAQSLFGVRADLKFGNTTISGVFSEQRSQSQNITTQGGGKLQEFDLYALDYEEDRHYFISHYFRNNYDKFLETYPYVNSPVQITRIEVWVTNRGYQTQNVRNIVALQDLGEANPDLTTLGNQVSNFINVNNVNHPPGNEVNQLDPDEIGFNGILNSQIRDIATVKNGFGNASVNEGYDYAILESARKLNSQEYSFHPQLGYISLNQRLSNDEILGIAYQYSFQGKIYQVGEFANGDIPGTSIIQNGNINQQNNQNQVVQTNNLIVKMLKSSVTDVRQPVWDLMMKNIYNTGAFQLSDEDFRLSILYTDPSPINYMTPVDDSIWPEKLDSEVLLNTMDLDRLNAYQDLVSNGDGFFDFIPGITVDPRYGRIIFPKVEPFGEFLFRLLDDPKSTKEKYSQENSYNKNQKRYVFREMYSLTKAAALEFTEKNKFQLKGRYKSEGGDGIKIGAFNVPRGSVRVTAGGRVLREGLDYIVNYEIGRVKIIDEGLKASNIPIEISVENNSFFNQQNKRFSGFNLNHRVSDKINIGGTLINLSENPLTQKANYGTEPVNNTMIGFNTNFSTEIPFLTRMVNKWPTIETNTPSQLSFRGEVANLAANDPRNTQLNGETNVYIDDFEGAQTNIDIKGFTAWNLSSVPINGVPGAKKEGLESGFSRSKLAWYSIDQVFYSRQPDGINNNDISLNETRRIFIDELFPEQDLVQGTPRTLPTFDLAYYPDEQGPYNNSPNSSYLSNIKEKWAGISRSLNATNFEQSNVEFIEFWLLDTFSEQETTSNDLGELVFHLGNISEDILRDGRKQFENGLPSTSEQTPTYETPWGKVPANQSLVYAFNSVEEDRILQDVGLDGLSDGEESSIFTNGPGDDPARDNYQYFLQVDGGILDRYKNYNGFENNTPIAFSDTNRGNTTEPDTEDINRDQSMNTIDSYFEYRVPINKNMQVGNHPFVTDVRENIKVNAPNGDEYTTRWIQFKVPIQKGYYENTSFNKYFDAINSIDDLRSIRFMRMLLTGFEQKVVFRFGTLDLVRGDWRRYNKPLNEEVLANSNTTVDISTVNILENENRIPINYVLPPEIQREQINNNNSIIRQNEQSLSFRVCDLKPKDSRGIFKGLDLDMRQYSKLRMFLHAESLPGQETLPGEGSEDEFDKRLVAFIRLGTDYQDNFYQIEIPLKPTSYRENMSNRYSAEEVWNPESNSIEVSIDLLAKLKAKALQELGLGETLYFDEELKPINEFSSISKLPGQKKYKFAIRGNPSLGNIKTLMIGVKNPSSKLGDVLCGEVWFNELRISGIDSRDGWAAIGAMDANLADFATFSATGRYSSIGFGSIDMSPNERAREELLQYDVISNANIGQLTPRKWGLQIPLSFATGETLITPEYDPFYQDIKLQDRLDTADRDSQRDSIKNQSISYTKRKSVSLIGIRKNRSGGDKQRFYSPENFDFSYAYNELKHRDYEIEMQQEFNLLLGTNYGHSFSPKPIEPFKKVKFFNQKKYWQWLQQLNFNLLPSSLQGSANVNRILNIQKFRQVYLEGVDASLQRSLPNLQQRNFLFDYNYVLSHNFSKSVRLNFNATTSSIIRQNSMVEAGIMNPFQPEKNALWQGIFNAGEPNNHLQTFSLNYKLPFQYIPFLSFVDATYNYTGNFNWQRGSEAWSQVKSDDGVSLGIVNTIQNNNTKTLNAALSFSKMYSALGLKSDSRTPFNKRVKVIKKINDSLSKSKNSFLKKGLTKLVDIMTLLKRVQASYSENNGSVLPGYLPSVGFAGGLQPTLGYTLGSQADIRYEAARQGWITGFPNFNQSFSQMHSSKFKATAQLIPFKGLIFDFNFDRDYMESRLENFKVTDQTYIPRNSNVYGNFGMSTILLRTAFNRSGDVESRNFQNFRDYRKQIAERLVKETYFEDSGFSEEGYPIGYGKNQQEVLLHSFIAAYTGASPERVDLSPIKRTPLPNWNLKFTGLTEIKSISKIFSRLSINHAYRASYTLTNFQSNFDFNPDQPNMTDKLGNLISERLYSNVNLIEQFNPLIRLDMEMNNSLKLIAELRKERAISLSLDNNLITESSGEEFIAGLGYRVNDVRFRTNFGGKRVTLKGDLNIRADVSYRDNITVLRNLEYDNNQVTAGQRILALKINADYALSRNLTALFFYDHNFSEFAISTAFPQTSIRSGFTVRYNFGN